MKQLLTDPSQSSNPTRSPRDRATTWLLAALLGLFAFLFALEKIYNYDIWWHLETGRHILDTGSIPNSDPFSFATEGAPWVPHYWLSDVVFAGLERTAGLDLLIVFKALVVALAFVTIFLLMVQEGVDPFLAAVVSGVAVPVARFRFLLRPGIFMLLLTAVFLYVLTRWGKERPGLLWILVPLMVLWANLHGSFVLGLVFVGCLLVAETMNSLAKRAKGQPSAWMPILLLAILLVVLAASTLANPFGWDLHRWVVGDYLTKSVSRGFEIEEHLPLQWGEHQGFWALVLATVGSFLVAWNRGRIFHFLVFVIGCILAFSSVRYVGVAALIAAPILGINLTNGLRRWSSHPVVSTRLKWVTLLPLLVLVGLLLFRSTFTEAKVYRFGIGINESRFPGSATAFIDRLGLVDNLYNSWEYGGYVLWWLPDQRDFLDGRSLHEQMDLFSAFQEMSDTEFDRMIAELDIGAALVKPQDKAGIRHFAGSRDFQPVYFDDQAIVYLRSDAAISEGLDPIRRFQLLQPEQIDFRYIARLATMPMSALVEEELRHAVELAPQAFKPRFLLAVFLEARGDPEAVSEYIAAAEANPSLAFTHYALGTRVAKLGLSQGRPDDVVSVLRMAEPYGLTAESYFLLGTAHYLADRLEEAESALRRSLDMQPRNLEARSNLGYVYLRSSRWTQAESLFRELIDEAPGNEDALYGLALTLQESGQMEEAAKTWKRFLDEFPDSRWRPKATANLQKIEAEN